MSLPGLARRAVHRSSDALVLAERVLEVALRLGRSRPSNVVLSRPRKCRAPDPAQQ